MTLNTSNDAIFSAIKALSINGNYNPETICYQFMELLVINADLYGVTTDTINGAGEFTDLEIITDKYFNDIGVLRAILRSKHMSNDFTLRECSSDVGDFTTHWPNIYRSMLFYKLHKQLFALTGKRDMFIFVAHDVVNALVREVVATTYGTGIGIDNLVTKCLDRIASFFGISVDDVIGDFRKYGHCSYVDYELSKSVANYYFTFSHIMREIITATIMYRHVSRIEYVKWLCSDNSLLQFHYQYLNTLLGTTEFTPTGTSTDAKYERNHSIEHAVLTRNYQQFMELIGVIEAMEEIYIPEDWIREMDTTVLNKWCIHNIDYEITKGGWLVAVTRLVL